MEPRNGAIGREDSGRNPGKENASAVTAAFAVWNHRIAPVFDVARQIHLVVVESGRIVSESEESLPGDGGAGKGLRLAELGVDTLVCGAISRSLQVMVAAYGIRMIPFVAGDLREIINAWLAGALEREVFAMPGCFVRDRGRIRGVRGVNRGGHVMGGKGQGGMRMGGGRGGGGRGGGGQGRGGQGRGARGMGTGGRGLGRMGGPKAAGPVGECVCPKCGHREPHVWGIPCSQQKCPKCGANMARE
jgi:predicted Fe-Mo cluster-binding NifX family protein